MEAWRRRKKSPWSSNCFCILRILLFALVTTKSLVCSDEVRSDITDAPHEAEPFFDTEINEIDSAKDDEDKTRYVVSKFVDSVYPIKFLNTTTNFTVLSDNELWHDLFKDCGRTTTLSCVKRNVFVYLDKSVSTVGDFAVTDGFVFKRNGNEMYENKYLKSKNVNDSTYSSDYSANVNEKEMDREFGETPVSENENTRSFNTFEGVTNLLYDKGVNFVMTHDLQLQLPETLFGGGIVRISPRALDRDGGALLRIDMNPDKENTEEGRILFKKHEWKKKLLMSFFALILVVKMIKVKLMYLLPMLLGVGTAKKIFLKILLFIFPAFRHLFKFCSTYHSNFAKFHHHHHQIAHHHHHHPVPVPVPIPSHPEPHLEQHEHIPFPGHIPVHEDQHEISPAGEPGWDLTGNDYHLSNRNEHLAQQAEKTLASWGLGNTHGNYKDTFDANFGDTATSSQSGMSAHHLAYNAYLDGHKLSGSNQPIQDPARIFYQPSKKPIPTVSKPSNFIHSNLIQDTQANFQPITPKYQQKVFNMPIGSTTASSILQLANESQFKQNLQVQMQNLELQQQLEHEKKLQQQKLQQQKVQGHNIRIQVLTPKPPQKNAIIVPVVFDPFYSPILQKIDNVFLHLGFTEEHCRERLVCSMYKSPMKYSPHSNLISVELSRDPEELQKPSVTNAAVTRFYRYVQAAREGQDQKDCLSLYPTCNINTEQIK